MKPGNKTKVLKALGTTGLILVGSLVLTGCADTSGSIASPAISKSKSTASVSKSNSKAPSPSSTPSAFTLKADPIDITCEQALSLQSLYDFDPNLALTPNHKTIFGSTGAQQESLGAVSCLLTNLSTQEEIQIVITKLNDESAKHERSAFAEPAVGETAFQVSSGVPGIFSAIDGVGTAQFMAGNYWVSIASKALSNGVQASPLSFLIWNNIK